MLCLVTKKPTSTEWMFPGLSKIYQVAWWQLTFLSLSDVTSHYLLLCYFKFEVPKDPFLCSFFLGYKSLPTVLSKDLEKHSQYTKLSTSNLEGEKEIFRILWGCCMSASIWFLLCINSNLLFKTSLDACF